MTDLKKAVFLDRDGTLNIEKPYLCDPDQLTLFPEVVPAMTQLIQLGYRLFIVTNQSGIGRGYYTLEDMHRVNARLIETLQPEGIEFDRIYLAPESPEEPSYGRKPSPNFLRDASREFGLQLDQSFMVGDKLSDLECGKNAGVRASILIRTGYGAETEAKLRSGKHPWWIADDLLNVVEMIRAKH